MAAFVMNRLMQSAVMMLVMSLLVFFGVFAIGNPIDILVDPQANREEIARAMAAFGLDKPVWDQYLTFLWNVLHGSLGNSFVFNEPALLLILQRLPASLELTFSAIFIAIVVGIPLGLWAGLKPDSFSGRMIEAGSILGFSLPTFWIALMLMLLFAVTLGWLPSTGRGSTVHVVGMDLSLFTWDGLKHLVLPAVTLSLSRIALFIRLGASGFREVIHMDYIKFARAKGLTRRRVILVHVLKNILIPIVTVLGLETSAILAFSVVTETIFAWPGMGRLMISSITVLDRPVIVAYLMMTVFLVIMINLTVDVLYSVLDPRVRHREAPA